MRQERNETTVENTSGAVARHMDLEVLGLSCITNMAAGVLPQPLDHAEVMETARRIRGQFIALLEGIVGQL